MMRHFGVDRFSPRVQCLGDVAITVAQDARDFECPRRQCFVQRSGAAIKHVVDTAEQAVERIGNLLHSGRGPVIERLRMQGKDFCRPVGMLGELAIEVAALAIEHALQRFEMFSPSRSAISFAGAPAIVSSKRDSRSASVSLIRRYACRWR